jgi:two-component system, cell cycle response regulator DivK
MARLLLVEDNEMNRDMLSRRLRRQGIEVELAEDGRRGLAAARQGPFDLILMDLSLPGLDGWTVAGLLKQDPATRAIPIIALTAHAMAGDRERAIEAGCDDYDTKPIDFPRLLAKVEALLSMKVKPASTPAGQGLPSPSSDSEVGHAGPVPSESSSGSLTAAPVRLDR